MYVCMYVTMYGTCTHVYPSHCIGVSKKASIKVVCWLSVVGKRGETSFASRLF